MDPFTTIALGIIANFAHNFMHGQRIAERTFGGLRRVLFGDAKPTSVRYRGSWTKRLLTMIKPGFDGTFI